MAANAIRAGQANVIVAGGMESMSNAPYLLPTACRSGGMRFGSQMMVDSLQHDGLVDAETALGMGLCGEKCATDNKITRQASDQYAMGTYERAIAGSTSFLLGEIVPVAARPSRPAAPSAAPPSGGAGEGLMVVDEEIANVRRLRGGHDCRRRGDHTRLTWPPLERSLYSSTRKRWWPCGPFSRRTGR